MKKLFRTGLMTALAVTLATGWCYAATIMFPYINSNPGNLSTIVNVINTATLANLGCNATETLQLHYRYMTKPVTAEPVDACDEKDFYRPSTTNDLVTFDVAGQIVSPNGGEAMFGDATDYNGGAGAPAFDLPNMGYTDARRGYLLVNHRCSVTGEVPAAGTGLLDGEVMLLDLVNGAAWGYEAALADQTVAAIGNYAFADIVAAPLFNPATGATTELLGENGATAAPVTLYPRDKFQTRFFVTPLIISTDVASTNDMSLTPVTQQKRTQIQLLDANGNVGVTDRDENPASGGGPIHVRCVAGIDLADLTGGFGTWFDAQGGWAYVDLLDPIALTDPPENEASVTTADDHCAVVYKLQFGSPDFAAGSMINSISVVRTDRIED